MNDVMLHCEQHGDYVGSVFRLTADRTIDSRCPQCREMAKQQDIDKHQNKHLIAKQHMIQRLFGSAGIPERFQQRTFANYRILYPKQEQILNIACQYALQFEDRLVNGGGLIFAGKPGTGKTHLAAAIANEVIHTGRSVLFVTVISAIRRVKACYRSAATNTEQQIIESFIVPDLLILDEVGIQFGTDAEKLILFEILNGRYEAVKPTILISNLTENELIQYIGTRVIDRLQEGSGVSLSFDWETYRPKVHMDSQLPKRIVPEVQWEI